MFDVVIYFNFYVDEKCNIDDFFAKNKFVVYEFFLMSIIVVNFLITIIVKILRDLNSKIISFET